MDHENGTREEAGEVRPQRKNKYYKTRGARAAAVRVYEHKSVLSPKKSSCISLKEKKKIFPLNGSGLFSLISIQAKWGCNLFPNRKQRAPSR